MSLIEKWMVRLLVVCSLFKIELNERQKHALLRFVEKEQKSDLRKTIDELEDDRTYPTAIINLEELKQKIGLNDVVAKQSTSEQSGCEK